jgi:DNA-directed RNA polymerase subunit RPC12/RpoP
MERGITKEEVQKVLRKKKKADYICLECGKKFYSTKAAERASWNGCPNCGGVDIDLNV